jgi:hypothetical protein
MNGAGLGIPRNFCNKPATKFLKNALSKLVMTWDSLDWLEMQYAIAKRVTTVLT